MSDNKENEEPKIKVTDKRMFAPDGTLRQEYRFLEDEAKKKEPTEREEAKKKPSSKPPSEGAEILGGPGARPSGSSGPGAAGDTADRASREAPRGGEGPDLELPPGVERDRGSDEAGARPGDAGRGPGFYELVAALAEPASVYLRNALQSPAEASQSLEVARLYIDLLDVVREKTAGNLSAQESDMLEDALQQLRLGYVQTKG